MVYPSSVDGAQGTLEERTHVANSCSVTLNITMDRTRSIPLLGTSGTLLLFVMTTCATPPRAGVTGGGNPQPKHPSIERLCPPAAATRPPDSCLPPGFTGNIIQTDGRLRAYEMCKVSVDGTFIVDYASIMIEQPGASPASPASIHALDGRTVQTFATFVGRGDRCGNPQNPRHPEDPPTHASPSPSR